MTKEDVYRRQNLGNASGLGSRCGLVLVDFVNAFVDASQFGGPHVAAAVKATQPLLQAFRAAQLPVAFTRVVFADDGSDANVFCLKVPLLARLTQSSHGSQVVPELEPQVGELVVRKTSASAFFSSQSIYSGGIDMSEKIASTGHSGRQASLSIQASGLMRSLSGVS